MVIETRSKSYFLRAISLARVVVTHRTYRAQHDPSDPSVAQRTQGTCEWSARAHPSLCRAPTVLRLLPRLTTVHAFLYCMNLRHY